MLLFSWHSIRNIEWAAVRDSEPPLGRACERDDSDGDGLRRHVPDRVRRSHAAHRRRPIRAGRTPSAAGSLGGSIQTQFGSFSFLIILFVLFLFYVKTFFRFFLKTS